MTSLAGLTGFCFILGGFFTVHEVALVEVQEIVEEAPFFIDVGLAVTDTVIKGGGTQSGYVPVQLVGHLPSLIQLGHVPVVPEAHVGTVPQGPPPSTTVSPKS